MENNPVLYNYLKRYQDDPTSRVFAPLAEAYRKAGLVDEAIDIAREGLRLHPHFVGGRVALARALFEKKEYSDVIDELQAVIQDVPDNLAAQRLMAESCLMMGRVSEALTAYKMLLFYAPDDIETAALVKELENQAYERGILVLRTDPVQASKNEALFNISPASVAIQEDPDAKRSFRMRRIETLQNLLQKVERYRLTQR
jgi:predicted Zn-dependent protease